MIISHAQGHYRVPARLIPSSFSVSCFGLSPSTTMPLLPSSPISLLPLESYLVVTGISLPMSLPSQETMGSWQSAAAETMP
ncbi:hypothetical protein NL676_039702 [Syzygium grande]|nr:hypothetical protein NL676_039702 [Syzygium grande]